MRTCSRFNYPALLWIVFHILFKKSILIGQNVRLRQKAKVSTAMDLLKLWNLTVHEIFASHIVRGWEVINFLILFKSLIYFFFYRSDWPEKCPLACINLIVFVSLVIFAFAILNVTKTIVLQRVPQQFDIAFLLVKVISIIVGLMWSEIHWIFEGSKYEKFTLYLLAELNLWRLWLFNFRKDDFSFI